MSSPISDQPRTSSVYQEMMSKGEDEKKVFHVVEDSFVLDELREFERFDQTDDSKSRNLYNIEESTRFTNVEKSDLK